uniref:Neur_chan_memb domain-containing protein n=1 Tax=Heterorhabditis bacteriophora TaxID=37862 RepID=A0A1I7WB01_HETBA
MQDLAVMFHNLVATFTIQITVLFWLKLMCTKEPSSTSLSTLYNSAKKPDSYQKGRNKVKCEYREAVEKR